MSVPLCSPAELGFPEFFKAWRPDQLTAIDRAIKSTKRFIAATIPTGGGKSLYGVATALLSPDVKRTLYLTSTKGLQDQLSNDFNTMGLVDIRGKRNYPCIAVDPGSSLHKYRRHRGYTGCDEGPCNVGVHCDHAPSRTEPHIRPYCGYYGAKWDANRASLVSTNYAFWFASNAYSDGMGDFDLIILDEAHDADKELESFLTFEVTTDDVQYLRSRLPDTDELDTWRNWAGHHYGNLASLIESREQMPPKDPEGAQEMRKLKAVLSKLSRLKDVEPLDWIVEREQYKAMFSPMKVNKYAEEFLFCGIKKVLLTSATLTRKTLQLLGIVLDQTETMEFKSSFPVERRPVIGVETSPDCRVNHRMHDSTKHVWMRRVDRLIEARRDRKGIIHTVSYARAKELVTQSEHRDIMIFHDKGDTQEAVRAFKAHQGGCVLVSPSLITGYDFPGDQCRYQILGKVPLPDTRGKIMTIRVQHDPEYPYYLAMQKVVQAAGRAVRGPEDWAEFLIVDSTWGDWFLKKAKKHAPRWFVDACEFTEVYPVPLEF